MMLRDLIAVVSLSLGMACSEAQSPASVRSVNGVPLAPNVHCLETDCRAYKVDPYVRTRSRYGIGCLGNVPPGTTPRTDLPPESYAATDVGRPGFPAMRSDELATLDRIRRYVHSKMLRIAWVDARDGREFIVFDATDGPCEVWAGGYGVLNGDCNEFYQPGENPYSTHAGSGCYPTSRPWMTPTPRRR